MASLFESIGASAVFLGNVERVAPLHLRSKAESSLASSTTEGARARSNQADEDR